MKPGARISAQLIIFVYVRQTWTGKDGQHHQVLGFDMFRVQDGMIAEHWDAD